MLETLSLKDLIALGVILFWPVIPLFWIPLHVMTIFFRKVRLLAYILPIFVWLPVIYLLYSFKDPLLSYRVVIPLLLTYPGWALFISGLIGQLVTPLYLRFGIIGIPEVSDKMKVSLARKGPFSISRHPTYLAHTMIFTGAFLISGVLAVAMIAIVDFFASLFITIPLEERELQRRFGEEYQAYMKRVPRFFPRLKL